MSGLNDKRRRGKREFSRDLAIKRAFLRQAETLNRHEGNIARHTAIQSWTNIIAVVTSIVMTAALAWIAWSQWQTSERQRELDEARSLNQYRVAVTYRSEREGYRPTESEDQPSFGLPAVVTVENVRGDSSIVAIIVRQYLYVSGPTESGDTAACRVLARHWFRRESDDRWKLNPEFTRILESARPNTPYGDSARVRSGPTEIIVTYYDVFGRLRNDRLRTYGAETSVDRSVERETDTADEVQIGYLRVEGPEFELHARGSRVLPECAGLLYHNIDLGSDFRPLHGMMRMGDKEPPPPTVMPELRP